MDENLIILRKKEWGISSREHKRNLAPGLRQEVCTFFYRQWAPREKSSRRIAEVAEDIGKAQQGEGQTYN